MLNENNTHFLSDRVKSQHEFRISEIEKHWKDSMDRIQTHSLDLRSNFQINSDHFHNQLKFIEGERVWCQIEQTDRLSNDSFCHTDINT